MGFITIGNEITGGNFNDEDYELLQTLSKQSASIIQSARLSEKLMIAQQMESVAKVGSFIIHDLKNHISTLDILLDNTREYIDNEDFQKDMIATLENTIKKMRRMMEKISAAPKEMNFNFELTNIVNIITELITELNLENNPKVKFIKDFCDNDVFAVVDEKYLKKVFANILLNALQSLPKADGTIEIAVRKDNNKITFSVKDNGCGMTEEFINKDLFKPFRTNKEGGLGIGLFQCHTIISAHPGAAIDVESEKGRGSKFTISLPITEGGMN